MDQVMTHTENENGKVTYVARFSFYESDCARLAQFMADARTVAVARGERFMGCSFDVDSDGFVTVYAAGMEPINL
jgi:hypothetical protein